MCGQCSSDGFFPAARRRRSSQAPSGMRIRPNTKIAGRIRKNTMPMYGLLCIPNRSAKNTTRNTTALIVVRTMPPIDSGLLIKRTVRTIPESWVTAPLFDSVDGRVDDEYDQTEPDCQAEGADQASAPLDRQRRRRGGQCRQLA